MKCLTFTILFFVFTSAKAHVQTSTSVRHYDDSKTQVTSPHLEVKGTFLGERAAIGAGYAMDIVSSASSDVKSYASKPIKDVRKEVSGNLGWLADDGSYGWSYINSKENDYQSHTYAVSATRDFFEKNTVLGFGFSYGDDVITSSANKNFKENMTNQNYSLSVSQVLGRTSVLQVLYDFRVENGYTASPYRKARVLRADGTIQALPENHPQTRNRNSFAVKYNYYLSPLKLALGSSLRYYLDSWKVQSWTIEQKATHDFTKWLSVALNLRYYTQSAANFYQDKYASTNTLGPFYTGNKTLAAYDTYQVGLRPLFVLQDEMNFYVKAEYYMQKFKNHTDVGSLDVTTDDKKLEIKATVIGAGFEAKF